MANYVKSTKSMAPGNFANFAKFVGFKIQDFAGNFLNPGPQILGFWMSARAWIQEVFRRILNLESMKLCKVCKVVGVQCVCVCACVYLIFDTLIIDTEKPPTSQLKHDPKLQPQI